MNGHVHPLTNNIQRGRYARTPVSSMVLPPTVPLGSINIEDGIYPNMYPFGVFPPPPYSEHPIAENNWQVRSQQRHIGLFSICLNYNFSILVNRTVRINQIESEDEPGYRQCCMYLSLIVLLFLAMLFAISMFGHDMRYG